MPLKTKELVIEKRKIGPNHPPFIIGEISANHNHSLKRALQLVEAIHEAGADAVKLQTYTPDTMTFDIHEREFLIQDPNSLWHGKNLYQLYQEAYTPWEWHKPIFARCRELGLIAFSSPFDDTAVDFLEDLNVPCYKIASLEITHHPLIQKVAPTQKPLIISTGAASLEEIQDAVSVAHQAGCQNILLLKCTCAYPTPHTSLNLKTIPHLQKTFKTPIGFSDHSLGIGAAIASIALGACVIEKHVTLSRTDGGVDAPFSAEPQELANLVTESKNVWESLGNIHYGPTPPETTSFAHRRSLYFSRDLKAGSVLTSQDIKAIRPGLGLSPKYSQDVIGLRLLQDVKKGTPVEWTILK